MYDEEDLLPLSGLQHMAFCQRRWALVQIEKLWAENRFTAEGNQLHERAHSGEVESRPGVPIRRTLPIHSFRLGLSGQVDVVEFVPMQGQSGGGMSLDGHKGSWKVYPIEYKRSRGGGVAGPYAVQLCGQAMCLEEMLGVQIAEGAIFDGTTKRRKAVQFSIGLRRTVERLATRMHELLARSKTPEPVLMSACVKCSLHELCQPELLTRPRSVSSYVSRMSRQLDEEA